MSRNCFSKPSSAIRDTSSSAQKCSHLYRSAGSLIGWHAVIAASRCGLTLTDGLGKTRKAGAMLAALRSGLGPWRTCSRKLQQQTRDSAIPDAPIRG